MTALLVPLLLAAVAVCGVVRRVDVYAALADGARSGGKILLSVFPNLVALLTAVAMLRASGAFEALAEALGPVLGRLGIPAETLPLMLVRPFSGSAALGVGAELIQNYGPDSPVGRTAAVMLGGTETTFYTVAVYFGAAGVRRSRYALPAALTADFVGFLAAALAVRLFF
ncbi:MAG: nucleoside recognition domain-containing protein [Oscillospiraceae bacterium]|nr:nucleoside recognition domain-containing protein [Oscillospiraceae bacterium]